MIASILVVMAMVMRLSRRRDILFSESVYHLIGTDAAFLHVRPHTTTSHQARHTSHFTHCTSHVTRHTSHVTRHTSHIAHHTSHVTPRVTRQTSHIAHSASHPLHVLCAAGRHSDALPYVAFLDPLAVGDSAKVDGGGRWLSPCKSCSLIVWQEHPYLFLFLNAAGEVYRRCDMPSRALDCLRRCNSAWNTSLEYHDYDLCALTCVL